LTQGELAARANTAHSAIARRESGRVNPALETLQKLVHTCGSELRSEIAPIDASSAVELESKMTLSPKQRLDQLVQAVSFLQAGRTEMAKLLHG